MLKLKRHQSLPSPGQVSNGSLSLLGDSDHSPLSLAGDVGGE